MSEISGAALEQIGKDTVQLGEGYWFGQDSYAIWKAATFLDRRLVHAGDDDNFHALAESHGIGSVEGDGEGPAQTVVRERRPSRR